MAGSRGGGFTRREGESRLEWVRPRRERRPAMLRAGAVGEMSFGVRTLGSVAGVSAFLFCAGPSVAAQPSLLRIELPTSFGLALPRAWCNDCGGASHGSVMMGLGVLFRPLDFVAAGVVIDRVSFPSREYDLVRAGGAVRFYLPDQGIADPYVQFALGKTSAKVDGTDAEREARGPPG